MAEKKSNRKTLIKNTPNKPTTPKKPDKKKTPKEPKKTYIWD